MASGCPREDLYWILRKKILFQQAYQALEQVALAEVPGGVQMWHCKT